LSKVHIFGFGEVGLKATTVTDIKNKRASGRAKDLADLEKLDGS
jgi:hypothetical protein